MGHFAKAAQAKVRNDDVMFTLQHQGVQAEFEISGDALRRHFGARDGTGSELLEAFERGRQEITDAAIKAFNAPNDGVIELGSGDFDGEGSEQAG